MRLLTPMHTHVHNSISPDLYVPFEKQYFLQIYLLVYKQLHSIYN
ncbi:protein of unknown function [Xenorhabdus bovienii]|uniref:Uncharacterized protein n=1 Tax=Xenorhabdus bovienii TaxID=40576 RepID=A0A0B6XEH4_XENBV|nr:protein of unknown function [Xenorhabdus bovienii]